MKIKIPKRIIDYFDSPQRIAPTSQENDVSITPEDNYDKARVKTDYVERSYGIK